MKFSRAGKSVGLETSDLNKQKGEGSWFALIGVCVSSMYVGRGDAEVGGARKVVQNKDFAILCVTLSESINLASLHFSINVMKI